LIFGEFKVRFSPARLGIVQLQVVRFVDRSGVRGMQSFSYSTKAVQAGSIALAD
jgi:hypothetical protein